MTGAVTPAAARPTAIVLGGGLAGIAAALRLAESGWRVTLLESRQSLGGRVFSYTDTGSGAELDNGQHVLVGACRNLIQFLQQIGAWPQWRLQAKLDVAVYNRSGRLGRLYGVNLPPPAHLLPAFLTYPHLGPMDKLQAVRGVMAAMRARRSSPPLEDITFYEWLRAHGQSERAIFNLWNVLIEGTLNDSVRDVSAAMGLMIVQDGMLQGRSEANLGYPAVALSPAIAEPARRYLESKGVCLRLGCTVRRLEINDGPRAGSVVTSDGQTLYADAFVSAVPFWILPSLLPDAMASLQPFAGLRQLRTSPIVNAHLTYDRTVMDGDFAYFLDSPLQWVFNRSAIQNPQRTAARQSLTVSISAAWNYVDLEREQLAGTIDSAVRLAYPRAAPANLLHATVVKQRNATFRCTPGASRWRPGPATPVANLFLAGEWTDTGWPSTMEGAIISGYNAAAAVMSSQLARQTPPGV